VPKRACAFASAETETRTARQNGRVEIEGACHAKGPSSRPSDDHARGLQGGCVPGGLIYGTDAFRPEAVTSHLASCRGGSSAASANGTHHRVLTWRACRVLRQPAHFRHRGFADARRSSMGNSVLQ
jgi:hypothetical protein